MREPNQNHSYANQTNYSKQAKNASKLKMKVPGEIFKNYIEEPNLVI